MSLYVIWEEREKCRSTVKIISERSISSTVHFIHTTTIYSERSISSSSRNLREPVQNYQKGAFHPTSKFRKISIQNFKNISIKVRKFQKNDKISKNFKKQKSRGRILFIFYLLRIGQSITMCYIERWFLIRKEHFAHK